MFMGDAYDWADDDDLSDDEVVQRFDALPNIEVQLPPGAVLVLPTSTYSGAVNIALRGCPWALADELDEGYRQLAEDRAAGRDSSSSWRTVQPHPEWLSGTRLPQDVRDHPIFRAFWRRENAVYCESAVRGEPAALAAAVEATAALVAAIRASSSAWR